jgi:hypothetical protein
MKYGVLTFSYNNFTQHRNAHAAEGSYSINLGDYMQTLAVRQFYRSIGIPEEDVVAVDRDSILHYDGDPVLLPMNACFYRWCFPLPSAIRPIFIGFQAHESVIQEFRAYFKAHEPIGCRDHATTECFRKLDIAAVTTGCLTLTFPRRESAPDAPRVLVVCGAGPAHRGVHFPAKDRAHLPARQHGNGGG